MHVLQCHCNLQNCNVHVIDVHPDHDIAIQHPEIAVKTWEHFCMIIYNHL